MRFSEPHKWQMTRVGRSQSISSRFSLGAICASLGFIVASVVSAQDDLRIVRFSPHTPANANSNIEVEFDRRMVPFGQRRITSEVAPATIEPELNCAWRWVGDRTLLCESSPGVPLLLATEYTITVLPGLMSEDGSSLAQEVVHQFSTAVVELRNAEIDEFKRPGTPVLELRFSQPVRKQDVEAHVFLEITEASFGVGDVARVPVEAGPKWNSTAALFNNGAWVKYPFYEVFQYERGNTESWYNYELKEDFDYSDIALERWLVKPINELPVSAKFDLIAERVPSVFGPEVRESIQVQGGFRTLGGFEFLGVECTNPRGDYINVDFRPRQSDEPISEPETCKSDAGVFLRFSAPVSASEIAKELEVTATGGEAKLKVGVWTGAYDRSPNSLDDYGPRFGVVRAPWVFRPYTKYTVTDGSPDSDGLVTSPSKIRDIYGRVLKAGLHQTFQTSHLARYVSLGSRRQRSPVLELETDSDIPVHSTNVETIPLHYRLFGSDGKLIEGVRHLRPPALQDVRLVSPLGIREILGNKSGAFFVRASVEHDDDVELSGLVTPYNVHAKIGFFDSLIWVTDLKTGKGIRNARVEIVTGNLKTLQFVNRGIEASTNRFGLANVPGFRDLSRHKFLPRSRNEVTSLIKVTGPKGLALLPIDWRFSTGLRHRYPTGSVAFPDYGYLDAWGTTSQGVYRRGDVVQFKLFLRSQDNFRHIAPPPGTYKLTVKDPLNGTAYESDFEPDAFGAYQGEFPVQWGAAMGWYRFVVRLSSEVEGQESTRFLDYGKRPEWEPMRVFVADFTPAPFKVSTELEHEKYGYDTVVRSRTSVRFHSGGAFAGGNGQVSIRLQEQNFKSSKAKHLPFRFSTNYWASKERELANIRALTDTSGELESEVQLDVAEPAYARIWATGVVADERGRDVYSKSSYAEYFGVDRYVGIKIDSWIFNAERESETKVLAVDRSGSLVEDVDVKVTIERRVTNTARVKSFDGAYRRDERTSWEEVHSCQGRATKTPFLCKYSPKAAGRLRISATCVSETFRCSSVSVERTVSGPNVVAWPDQFGQRMTLGLSGDDFKAGDTAQILVQNPFPKALALVSVERYGILDHWTTTLEHSAEVIEIPLKSEYRPGVYVSVVATAPRVAGSAEIPIENVGAVDLGKPDFRWGTVKIPVAADRHRIAIEVTTDRETYKPREEVKVRLVAKPQTGRRWKEPVEFAVSVLDESVLDLVKGGTDYFDPYKGFAKLHRIGVSNYNLLMQVVGRQHFKLKKGVSPGGDGGGAIDLRSVSRFVSYWNPSIVADRKGNASFEFTLPDNVTGWRVLALASTPTNRFGLGQGSFVTRTLTETRAAMPNLVNAEDRFDAEFVVANRMNVDRVVDVEVVATGPVKGGRVEAQHEVQLPAGERSTVSLPIQVARLPDTPSGIASGEIRFEVRAGDQLDSDGLLHVLPVRQVHRREFEATFGSVQSGSVRETFALPTDATDASTQVQISASPTVVGDLSQAFQFMRDYPFRCGEQSMSKALFAAHYEVFKERLDAQFQWPNRSDLLENFLSGLSKFQAPNGGFSYWVPRDKRVDPFLSAYIALGFSFLEEIGYSVPEDAGQSLDEYLMKLLRKDIAPYHYSQERSITARALALHALSRSRSDGLTVDLLERYVESMKYANVFGLANFLSAALRTSGADSLADQVRSRLFNYSSRTDQTLHFEKAMDPVSGVAGASRLRSQCAVLSALVYAYKDGRAFASSNDIEALTRWIRSAGGFSGGTTQESAFCLLAVSDYASAQEQNDPDVQFSVSMEFEDSTEHLLGESEFSAFLDPPWVSTHAVSSEHQGKRGSLNFIAEGLGRVNYGARLSYVPKRRLEEPTNSGIGIIREYSVKSEDGWTVLDSGVAMAQGDRVRVDLYIDIPANRDFVVVGDPVPAGLEPINQGLATANVTSDPTDYEYADPRSHYHSAPYWNGFRSEGVGFYHREIGHANVVFYSERLSARRYRLTWFGQAVARGTFRAPRARAEQMYAPEVFGESNLFEVIVGG